MKRIKCIIIESKERKVRSIKKLTPEELFKNWFSVLN